MNKVVKKNVISIIIVVLIVIIALISFGLVTKSKGSIFDNLIGDIEVDVDTTKKSNTIDKGDEVILVENYTITAKPKKFYKYKLVLESNNKVSYEVYKGDTLVSKESNVPKGTSILIDSKFESETEVFKVIVKVYDYNEETYNNRVTFVY